MSSEKSAIRIGRESEWTGSGTTWDILIDGDEVGEFKWKAFGWSWKPQVFELRPGRHSLRVVVRPNKDICSPLVEFNLEASETAEFTCGRRDNSLRPALFIERLSNISRDVHKSAGQTEISVVLEESTTQIEAAAEVVHVPAGVSIKVKRSRKVEHTVDFESRTTDSIGLSAGLKEVIRASVVREMEERTRHSYQKCETIEYEVDLQGERSGHYTLIWVDTWRHGVASSRAKDVTVPFRFRERTELKVVEGQVGTHD